MTSNTLVIIRSVTVVFGKIFHIFIVYCIFSLLVYQNVVLFLQTGIQLAASKNRRCQGQRSSHGNRQDSLCPQQLPALSSAEGQSGRAAKAGHGLPLCACCLIKRLLFVLSLSKIEKFFPHVLEKEKSRAEGEPPLLSPEEFAFAKE